MRMVSDVDYHTCCLRPCRPAPPPMFTIERKAALILGMKRFPEQRLRLMEILNGVWIVVITTSENDNV